MADNWKNLKENQTPLVFLRMRWLKICRVETLEASKIEYGSIKGKGFSFEVRLVKLYSELRKTMSEK